MFGARFFLFGHSRRFSFFLASSCVFFPLYFLFMLVHYAIRPVFHFFWPLSFVRDPMALFLIHSCFCLSLRIDTFYLFAIVFPLSLRRFCSQIFYRNTLCNREAMAIPIIKNKANENEKSEKKNRKKLKRMKKKEKNRNSLVKEKAVGKKKVLRYGSNGNE